jgi:hypothetical protein
MQFGVGDIPPTTFHDAVKKNTGSSHKCFSSFYVAICIHFVLADHTHIALDKSGAHATYH